MVAVRPQPARLAPGSVRTRTVAWMRRETPGPGGTRVVSPAVVVGQTAHAGQPGTSGQTGKPHAATGHHLPFRFHWWAHWCRTRSVSGGDRCRCHRSAGDATSVAASGWAVAEGLRGAVAGTGRSGRGGRTRPGGGQSKLAATIASNSACNHAGSAQTSSVNSPAVVGRVVSGIIDHSPARPCVRHQVMHRYPCTYSSYLRLCQPPSEIIWRHQHNAPRGREGSGCGRSGQTRRPGLSCVHPRASRPDGGRAGGVPAQPGHCGPATTTTPPTPTPDHAHQPLTPSRRPPANTAPHRGDFITKVTKGINNDQRSRPVDAVAGLACRHR